MTTQFPLAPKCPRCGSPMPGDLELAALATKAYVGLRDRRLVIPDRVMEALKSVASALRCKAGLCGGEAP